jgi:hypothetical protein
MGEASVVGKIAAFIEETPPLIGYADLGSSTEIGEAGESGDARRRLSAGESYCNDPLMRKPVIKG